MADSGLMDSKMVMVTAGIVVMVIAMVYRWCNEDNDGALARMLMFIVMVIL